MTDKEKIHQILSSLWKNDDSVGKMCYNQALQDVQTAIDLQEEPKTDWLQELQKRLDSLSKEDFKNVMAKYSRYGKEKPVNEDLEKEIKQYCIHHGYLDSLEDCGYTFNEQVGDIARHFVNWQKQKDSIVSEDLEEASKEWLKPQLDKSYVSYGEDKMMELTHFNGYDMLDAIEFGAKWKHEQMMKQVRQP